MLNDQVQVPEAQTRFMLSIVHCGCAAAIMETTPDRSTRFSAFGAGAAIATPERIAATTALVNFIFNDLFWVLCCAEFRSTGRLAMRVRVTKALYQRACLDLYSTLHMPKTLHVVQVTGGGERSYEMQPPECSAEVQGDGVRIHPDPVSFHCSLHKQVTTNRIESLFVYAGDEAIKFGCSSLLDGEMFSYIHRSRIWTVVSWRAWHAITSQKFAILIPTSTYSHCVTT